MSDEHERAHALTWELIPWVVNGSASTRDKERVEVHLQECVDCRDEFARQMQMLAGIGNVDDAMVDPRPVFRRVLARIDTDQEFALRESSDVTAAAQFDPNANGDPPSNRERRAGHYWTRALVAAVVLQAIGLGLLGAVILAHKSNSDSVVRGAQTAYSTLSQGDTVAPTATIRLVPSPEISLADLKQLLNSLNLRIVESNDDNAIFKLASTAGPLSQQAADLAIATLRSKSGVLLAEPIVTQLPVRR